MKICGIIAEYNPLHRGHAHHIREARRLSGCDRLVAVMSGNFTQRGEPALVDKWTRARMALAAGADLVLELPAGWAVQPAQGFARGGVGILAGLGCVDTLAFGAESGTAEDFARVAALLGDEPEPLRQLIREELGRGLLHPAARARAVAAYLSGTGDAALAGTAQALLSSPNNILGLEYLQALSQNPSGMTPLVIPRVGSGYHAPAMEGSLSSATAIRRAILAGEPFEEAIPPECLGPLTDALARGEGPVCWRDFERMLLYRLRTMDAADLPDLAEGLEQRMLRAAREETEFEPWLAAVKVRRYARTRIQRAAVHTLLGVTAADFALLRERFPRYARVLGLRASARPLLAHLSRSAQIDVISRPARYAPQDGACRLLWAIDRRATDLYALALPGPLGRSGRDLSQGLVFLED